MGIVYSFKIREGADVDDECALGTGAAAFHVGVESFTAEEEEEEEEKARGEKYVL